MIQISIIVPTLNESGNIHELLGRIITNAEKVVGQNFEVIFVDDDSNDGTRDHIHKWLHDPRIKLIHRREEKGLASALLIGAKASRGEILLVMDADLSHPPESIPDLVEPILSEKKDLVIGSRYVSGGATPDWSLLRLYSSRIATLPARLLTNIRDPLSGYLAVRKQVLLSLGQDVPGFKIGLALLVRGGTSQRIQEVPVTFHQRKKGQSKICLPVVLSYFYQLSRLAGGNISTTTCLRFGLVGIIGLIIDFSAFHALFYAGFGLGPANIISFTIAVLLNYLLNRKWAFADPRFGWKIFFSKYALFISIALMALFLRGGILALFATTWHLPVSIALIAAIASGAVVNYIGSAFFVFSKDSDWLTSDIRWHVLAVGIIGYTVLLRIVYMGLPELLHQEAYYWNYGQHLALGYLDHPPLIAWLIRGSTEIFGTNEYAIRLVAFLCWMITTFFSYRTARFLFDFTTALGVIVLIAVLPAFFCTGFISTPDAPLIACWAAVLFFLQKALIQGQQSAWYGVGIALGLGMLSKYTIVFLVPCIFVYLVINRSSREWFSKPQPYVAALISLLLFLPVIVWNAEHDWVSFVFQGPQRLSGSFEFSLDILLGSILLLITPTGFLAAVGFILGKKILLNRTSTYGIKTEIYSFVYIFTLVPLSIFILFSTFSDFKINWTAPIWLAFLPFMVKTMVTTPGVRTGRMLSMIHQTWPSTIIGTTVVYGAILYYAVLGFPGVGYFGDQPFLLGWEDLANKIERYKVNVEEDHTPPIVVGIDKYKIASGLSFYRKKLLTKQGDDMSGNVSSETAGRNFFGENSLMYAFWYPNDQYNGRSMILVSDKREKLNKKIIAKSFRKLGSIREMNIMKNGKTVKPYYIRLCHDYRPIAGSAIASLAENNSVILSVKKF